MNRPVEAVIFDLDGTLFDSREMIFRQAEIMSFEFTGRQASRQEIARAVHGTLHDVIRAVCGADVDIAKAVARYQELYHETLPLLRVYDGTHELLDALVAAEISCGILTSADRQYLAQVERFNLMNYFTVLATVDDVPYPKPHPDSINHVLAKLNVSADSAVMVGDTIADMQVAKAVGARGIGVSHGFGVEADLVAAGASHIAHSLDHVATLLDVTPSVVDSVLQPKPLLDMV